MTHRSYKFRFYPTKVQEQQLTQTFGAVRYVYNRGLEVRKNAWESERKSVGFYETCKMLTQWKKEEETSWLNNPSRAVLMVSLNNLDKSYKTFFKNKKGYPKFKKRGVSRESATFLKTRFRFKSTGLYLEKITGPIKVAWSRVLPEGLEPSQCTVSKDKAGRYFISLLFDEENEKLPENNNAVGVDLGITHYAILSNGEKIDNPKFLEKDLKKLKRAQQSLSRKQKGSNNREKAKLKVAKIHAKIADKRRDHLHKLSTRLINENQVICLEDLSVKNMVKNKNLSKAISSASWGMFREMLTYKAEWYGRELVVIDKWFPSSKTCSSCGFVLDKLELSVRHWTCECGITHDRDINAAKNILAAGLAESLNACGDDVRPLRGRLSEKQELITKEKM